MTFRDYTEIKEQVKNHYTLMRKNQTLEYLEKMENKWLNFDTKELTIREAFKILENYVDSSDPDTKFPNLEHMFQTAEAIRKDGHPEWFQLVGLLHDMGKIMFMNDKAEDGQVGTAEGPQWGLGGDTWILGCAIPDCVVYPELNILNPDMKNNKYNSKYGIYEENCGLANLRFAFGHDEYMYRMLLYNNCAIPAEGLAMIRYHSCYPLHQSNTYDHLLNKGDYILLEWVRKFNKYDLYTKKDNRPNVEKLWPYYQKIIDKYCPGRLKW